MLLSYIASAIAKLLAVYERSRQILFLFGIRQYGFTTAGVAFYRARRKKRSGRGRSIEPVDRVGTDSTGKLSEERDRRIRDKNSQIKNRDVGSNGTHFEKQPAFSGPHWAFSSCTTENTRVDRPYSKEKKKGMKKRTFTDTVSFPINTRDRKRHRENFLLSGLCIPQTSVLSGLSQTAYFGPPLIASECLSTLPFSTRPKVHGSDSTPGRTYIYNLNSRRKESFLFSYIHRLATP